MATATAEAPTTAVAVRSLADQLAERNVTNAQYLVLAKSLYPGAKPESVLMVLDYCAARKLDPMKKPCHIVPMKVKVGDNYEWRDVVLPGIYEYRTTAMRTGKYLGHTPPQFGEVVEFGGVDAPEWCAMTFKRAAANGAVIEFPVQVYFREVCNTKDEWKDNKKTGRVIANDRWSKAPIQMLLKCTEAAGLREAFPDEFGGEATFDEMAGRDSIDDAAPPAATIKPAQRTSQQQPAATPEPTPATVDVEPVVEQPSAPVTAPANVGIIATVEPKGDSAAMLILSTGFRASTRDGEVIRAAVAHRDNQTLVELITQPSADPTKYAPRLVEMVKLETGEATA